MRLAGVHAGQRIHEQIDEHVGSGLDDGDGNLRLSQRALVPGEDAGHHTRDAGTGVLPEPSFLLMRSGIMRGIGATPRS